MSIFTGSSQGDVITPTFVSAGVLASGGVLPGGGADLLIGGDGNDTLNGGPGGDTVQGGAGDDLVLWTLGGGNDVVDGGAGAHDTFSYSGDDGRQENITVSAAGTHVSLLGGASGAHEDLVNVEQLNLNPLNGTDIVTLNLSGLDVTGLRDVRVDLANAAGVADSLVDTVVVNGGDQPIGAYLAYERSSGVVSYSPQFQDGFAIIRSQVELSNFDLTDKLVLNGGTGADDLNDYSFPPNGGIDHPLPGPRITLNGADGDDHVFGLDGDTLLGGAGNDTVYLANGGGVVDGGIGDDLLVWSSPFGPGSATIKGGEGVDTLVTTYSGATDVSLGSGGQLAIASGPGTHAVASGVERLSLVAGLPATDPDQDTLNIGDLAGTAVQDVTVDLTDGQAGLTVRVAGGGGADGIAVETFESASGRVANVLGTIANPLGGVGRIQVRNADTHQTLDVDGGAGDDQISVFSNNYNSGLVVHGGAGNDTISADRFSADGINAFGDNGNDSINAATGGFVQGGAGSDTLASGNSSFFIFNTGETGSDVILGFHNHAASGFHDTVILHGALDASFADAVANHHIVQMGADVMVNEGVGLMVTLKSVTLASLGASDFVFG